MSVAYATLTRGDDMMRNKGKWQYRFKDNPLEKAFAQEWEDRNNGRMGPDTLDYMLAEDPNRPMGEVSDRDREVAATVIQWLGSHVGSRFVKNVLCKECSAPWCNR
jgi:hypothetical protein